MSEIDFDVMISLIADRYGKIDIACPECGPTRRTSANRKRKVCRVWRDNPDFIGYHCCRCRLKGSVRRHGAQHDINWKELEKLRAEAAARDADYAALQQRKARWMWQRACPIQRTPAETYLRSRGIGCDLPMTLRFLAPDRPGRHPAMIAAFGMAEEPEPGTLCIAEDSLVGLHLTLLKPDGSSKADVDPNKIMVGRSIGMPIVLAAANDLLGLAITEGIENGLSVHEDTGRGVWVAGSASRLPALANAIPRYIDCVTIVADNDNAGQEGAHGLARHACEIGFYVEVETLEQMNVDTTQMRTAA
jgi:hypothetical protein